MGRIYQLSNRHSAAIAYYTTALQADPMLWSAFEELCVLGAEQETEQYVSSSGGRKFHPADMATPSTAPNLGVHGRQQSAAPEPMSGMSMPPQREAPGSIVWPLAAVGVDMTQVRAASALQHASRGRATRPRSPRVPPAGLHCLRLRAGCCRLHARCYLCCAGSRHPDPTTGRVCHPTNGRPAVGCAALQAAARAALFVQRAPILPSALLALQSCAALQAMRLGHCTHAQPMRRAAASAQSRPGPSGSLPRHDDAEPVGWRAVDHPAVGGGRALNWPAAQVPR